MEVTSLQEILEIAEEVCMNKEEKKLREYIRKKIFKTFPDFQTLLFSFS